MNPRVLIVEDQQDQASAMCLYLERIPDTVKRSYGIDEFKIDQAGSVSSALNLLSNAERYALPYDMLLLDLGLPKDEGSYQEYPTNGYEILERVMATGAARRVIMISVFNDYEFVTNAFRVGAFDFIAKPFAREVLQTHVLNCWGHILTNESARILDQRIKGLIPYANLGLAHQFTSCFSTFLNLATRAVDNIERALTERLGTDFTVDSHDDLTRHIRMHKEAGSEASKEWVKLQLYLSGSDERPQVEMVEDMLTGIREKLLPCLTIKKARLLLDPAQSGKAPVLTFQQDVQAVLTEIIVGGLSELPDGGEERTIKITIEENESRIAVRFEDDLGPLSMEDAKAINEGYSAIPDPEFGRKWGLSVAQHIALRGGGALVIASQNNNGNSITYFIPIAI
jgi:CheY-like chemotaxis protein